ncbi:MAG: PEGA domain-containing protein, partial [Gottschalkiaceae bacterium]
KEVVVDIGTALPTTGIVNFTINPKDAKLYINNKEYKDYSKPIILDFGSYDIKIVKDNYVTAERKLVVNEAFMTVEISMEKTAKFIHVDKPEGVELYIDANYIGIIPIHTPIDSGSHNITLRKEGYYSKMHSVLIEDNGQDAYFSFPDLIEMPSEVENE